MRSIPPPLLLACVVLALVAVPAAASAVTVTSISPSVAYEDSTRTYDVYGTGFFVGAQVTLTQRTEGLPDFVIDATGEDWIDFTHIRCTITVPAGVIRPPASQGPFDITVQNPKADSGSLSFSFRVLPRPTVAGILPTGRPAPSVFTARLDGTGFRNGAEVYLQGGTGGTSTFYATGETVVSSTVIDCTFNIPSSAYPGPYDVYVRNHPDLDYLFCMNDAFIVQLPTSTYLWSVSPGSAIPGATLTVDVNGYGFTNGAEVRVEGGVGGTTIIEATGETFVSGNQIRCTLSIPTDAYIGPYDVYLRNPGGEWVSESAAFTVTAPTPTVTGISPGSGACGETLANVTVTGAGFTRGAQITLYHEQHPAWFDATDEVWVSPTQIRCTLAIPPGALPGLYAARVVNPGGAQSSSSAGFRVVTPTPTVTRISPSSAYPGETLTTVNVTGTGFASGAEIALMNGPGPLMPTIAAAGETWVNSTTIRCTLAIPADTYPGFFDIAVRNPAGDWVFKADAFTVTAPIPTVTEISPNSALVGTTLGTVTVTGTGFANGAEVAINGGNSSTWIYATGETWVSPTQIRCSLAIPPDAYPGSYGVYVRNPGIAEWYGRLSRFTVLAPTPTVTGVSPNSALRGTTLSTVNVYGTGFTRGAVVALIGGYDWIYATDVSWVSPTQLQCTLAIPENAAHNFYNVGVINPGGPYPTSTVVFYVTAPTPTVTGISPNTAAPDTSGSFYVSGTGFAYGAEVEIRGGNGSATTIGVVGSSRVNSTTILCSLIIPSDTPPGPYDLFVRNSGGEWVSKAAAFTVTAPTPTVTGISPASAHVGDMLTGVHVYGTNFTPGAQVAIEGGTVGAGGFTEVYATDETVINSTTIRCSLAIPGDASPGPYAVHVWNPGQEWGFKADAFTVIAPTPTLVAIPGGAGLPTDTNTDGLYEDVNGNGRKDFADVVLYFNQMTWIAANEPVPAFDYNGNGRIDFADVVWLFDHF